MGKITILWNFFEMEERTTLCLKQKIFFQYSDITNDYQCHKQIMFGEIRFFSYLSHGVLTSVIILNNNKTGIEWTPGTDLFYNEKI